MNNIYKILTNIIPIFLEVNVFYTKLRKDDKKPELQKMLFIVFFFNKLWQIELAIDWTDGAWLS